MNKEENKSLLKSIKALAALKEMSDEVFDHFIVAFPEASEIVIRQAGSFMFITFVMDDVAMRAAYGANAKQLYYIKYLNVNRLDSKTTKYLATEYPGYSIVRGTEVNNGQNTVDLITISNNDTEIIVKFVK